MITLRIRSSDGTRRLTVPADALLSTLSQRIHTEFSDVLEGKDFKLWRHGDPARRHLLAGIDGGKSFAEMRISNGEMLYLEPIARPPPVSIHAQEITQSLAVAPMAQGVESSAFGHAAIYRRIRELLA